MVERIVSGAAPRCFLMVGLLMTAASSAYAWSWPWDKSHPSEAEIRAWMKGTIRDHLRIEEIELRTQEMREGIIEHSETRVRAVIEVEEDLFRTGDHLSDSPYTERGPMAFDRVSEKGKTIEVFGVARAVARGEGWNGEFEWDDRTVYRLGSPRSDIPNDAVLRDSGEHRAALDAMRSYREVLQETVSISVAGTVVCDGFVHRGTFAIDELSVDAAGEDARLVYRKLGFEVSEPVERRLSVEKQRHGEYFSIKGDDWFENFSVRVEDGRPVFGHGGCGGGRFYPADEVPEDIRASRAMVAAFLDGLAPGAVSVNAQGDGEPMDVTAEILEVGERGFTMSLQHPMHLNGWFHDSHPRTISTVQVRFVDAPAQMMIRSSVEGRGDPVMKAYCGPELSIEGPGAFRIDAVKNYLCDEHFVIGG